jgi:electron transport complex protein RnfC
MKEDNDLAKLFRGGVHPDDSKHTRNEPVKRLEPAEQLILSISQHIGAPSRPIVSAGERVLKYQPLAAPGGFVSAALHAPTSGTVKAVEPAPHPSGRLVTAIVIEPDGLDEAVDTGVSSDPNLEKGP